jgi:hypothetical protein
VLPRRDDRGLTIEKFSCKRQKVFEKCWIPS